MGYVICTRDDCPENRVLKEAYEHSADDTVCGACGDPVSEAPADVGNPGDVLPPDLADG